MVSAGSTPTATSWSRVSGGSDAVGAPPVLPEVPMFSDWTRIRVPS
jgi:hypothetical protein